MRLPDRQADPHEHAGQQQAAAAAGRHRFGKGLSKTPRARMLPVVGIDLVIDEVDGPLAGKAFFALAIP